MMTVGRLLPIAAFALGLSACVNAPIATAPPSDREAIASALMRDIEVLASDDFGGRQPGTDGEHRTVQFIIDNMQSAGLVSGTNDPGSAWRAPVELVSTRPRDSSIRVTTNRGSQDIAAEAGFAFTSGRRLLIEDGELVFVGREGENVAADAISGKVVVMLGEPGVSPARRAALFESDPAAIITVVEDDDEIANVRRAFDRERIGLTSEEIPRLTAFVTDAAMEGALGADRWRDLVERADGEGLEPRRLDATASIDATSQRRAFTSSNVIGLLPGTVRGSGAVVLLAHWDHLGACGDEGSGDTVCNGAVDNASGIAVLLELARRLGANGPFERDIYFLATTAEESGLLGARAFAEAPPMPLDTIVAAFNFDTVAVAPEGSTIGFVGEGRTALDPLILATLSDTGRELGDKDFAEQFVRRQDGWALLDKGVPAVLLSTSYSSEIVLGPYLASDYHRPSDEIGRIELGGAIDDLLLHEELVRRVASTAFQMPDAP